MTDTPQTKPHAQVLKMPAERYFALGRGNPLMLSSSALKKAATPIEWTKAREATTQMAWGSLVDCIALTPENIAESYHVLPTDAPDKPTKAMLEAKKPSDESVKRIEYWRKVELQSVGKHVVTGAEFSRASRAAACVRNHPIVKRIIEGASFQDCYTGEIPEGFHEELQGLPAFPAKAMVDIVPAADGPYGDALVDLKTTGSLEDEALRSTIDDFEYHLSAAWYLAMHNLASPQQRRNKFIHVWSCRDNPELVRVTELDYRDIVVGSRLIVERIRKIHKYATMGSPLEDFECKVPVLTRKRWAWHRDVDNQLVPEDIVPWKN